MFLLHFQTYIRITTIMLLSLPTLWVLDLQLCTSPEQLSIVSLLLFNNTIFTPPPTVPSGYPKNLTAIAVSSTSVSHTWKPLAPQDQNGIITGYVLNVMSLRSKESFEISVLNSTLQTSVDALTPYSTYIISIAATTSVGIGPFSPVTTVNTPEDGRSSLL